MPRLQNLSMFGMAGTGADSCRQFSAMTVAYWTCPKLRNIQDARETDDQEAKHGVLAS